MTASFAIAVFIVMDIAMIATLAYVMSRARGLTPHVSVNEISTTAQTAARPTHRAPARRSWQTPRPLAAAGS